MYTYHSLLISLLAEESHRPENLVYMEQAEREHGPNELALFILPESNIRQCSRYGHRDVRFADVKH